MRILAHLSKQKKTKRKLNKSAVDQNSFQMSMKEQAVFLRDNRFLFFY